MDSPLSDPTALTAERIKMLLGEVDDLLEGHTIELLAVGGAPLTVYWDEQGTPRQNPTYDIDAVEARIFPTDYSSRTTFRIDISILFFPDPLRDAIETLRQKYTLDDHWFNNNVKMSLRPTMNLDPEVMFQGKNLTVYRPSISAQLALKLISGREKDVYDTLRLIQETGVTRWTDCSMWYQTTSAREVSTSRFASSPLTG